VENITTAFATEYTESTEGHRQKTSQRRELLAQRANSSKKERVSFF